MGRHEGSSSAAASSSSAAATSSSAPASGQRVTGAVPAAQGDTSAPSSSTRTPTTLTQVLTTTTIGNPSSTLTPTTVLLTVTPTTPTTASNPPLTTIFTPPARCAHIEYSFSAAQSGTSTFWRDASGPGLGTQSACYPPGFAAVQTSSNLQYSPGVCPSGYLPASSATAPSRSAMTSWCCRSGLKYAQDFGCFTTITTPTVVRLNAESTTTMSTAFVAADWAIQVAWNSADLNLFTPASAPLIEASAAAANNTQANMTGQEIAGLGIGVPAAVAAIAVACYALWRRKRRQPHHAELLDDDPSEMEQTYSTWTPEPKRTDTPHIEVPVPTVQSRRFDVAYRVGEPGPSYSTSYSPPEAALDETEPPAEPR